MSRPLIGISVAQYTEYPGQYDLPGHGITQTYAQALFAVGAIPVLLPLIPPAAGQLVERLDGLLLSGGEDLHPRFYGEVPHPKLGAVDSLRDEMEAVVYRAARSRGLPVLGICRGMQVINALEGGTLHQHIDGHSQGLPVDGLAHGVAFVGHGRLASHHAGRLRVNSHHHQAVKDVAPGFTVVACSDDGHVEAMEQADVLCVQWHPEMTFTSSPETIGTFQAFISLFQGSGGVSQVASGKGHRSTGDAPVVPAGHAPGE